MAQNRYNYYLVKADPNKSDKAQSPFLLAKYAKEVTKFGGAISYNLVISPQGHCSLVPRRHPLNESDKTLETIVPRAGEMYDYVIKEGKDGKPELIVGKGGHWFIADKAPTVYAAGSMRFIKRESKSDNAAEAGTYLELYDAEAGTYNVNFSGLAREERIEYKVSLNKVFEAVGLPTDKYDYQRFLDAERKSLAKLNEPEHLTATPVTNTPVKPQKRCDFSCQFFYHVAVPVALGGLAVAVYSLTG